MLDWAVFSGALVGAGIEFFEVAAIAYALARAGFPREAIAGTIVGTALVAIAGLVLGAGLARVPLQLLRLATGVLLLWFGGSWVRKSIRRIRSGGRAAWVSDPLGVAGAHVSLPRASFSGSNFVVMTKSAGLEAFEAGIVVLTLGLPSGAWGAAWLGAGIALACTMVIVAALHGHLKRLPEVVIKLGAGLLLLTFGTFWAMEGVRGEAPLGDALLPILYVTYAAISLGLIRWRAPQRERDEAGGEAHD